MRTGRFILILTAAAVLSMLITPCFAQQKAERPPHREEGFRPAPPMGTDKPEEITKEMMDHFIGQIAKTDPNQAKKLEQLQKENPQELKKIMHEQAVKNAENRKAKFGDRMRQRNDQYIEWLGENYPQEANDLSELKAKKPEFYIDRLSLSMRKYRRIKEAQDENDTEMVNVLKKEMELNKQQYDLISNIKSTKDENKKQEMINELKDVLSQKYDIIVQRKQMAYERLLKKLEELKIQVKESKDNVQQWKDTEFKDKNIEARLKETLSNDEKFHWDN